MTPSQINQAIAEMCGPPLFVMVKHGLYYRPNASGYTGEISLAGRWPEAEARKLEGSKGYPDEVKAVPAPVPDYHGSLDAMAAAEKTLDSHQCHAFNALLMDLKLPRCERTSEAEHWSWHATAAQRAEAFLRVKGKWVD